MGLRVTAIVRMVTGRFGPKSFRPGVVSALCRFGPGRPEVISLNGILKLLFNLKPGKAAGPDKIRPLILKELRAELAHIIKVILERSLETGKLLTVSSSSSAKRSGFFTECTFDQQRGKETANSFQG